MGIELLAVAGVLLLGGGLTMLIMSLRKPEGVATLDQIGTYGYVAESVGGAEDAGRRPLDSLAGRLGDTAAKRLGRFSETEVRQKLVSAGMYGTTPRKVLGYQVLASIFLTLARALGNSAARLLLRARDRRCDRGRADRLVPPDGVRRPHDASALREDRPPDAGHDRPARRHDRGRVSASSRRCASPPRGSRIRSGRRSG